MTKINIDEATVAELTAAAQLMQLDVPAGSTRAAIVALIRQSGFEGDEVDIPAKAEPKKAAKTPSPANASTVRIMIHKDEKNTDDVYVGVNEKSWLIQRGVPVDVPVEVYHVLKNATRWVYPETEDGIGEPIESPAYPFNVLSAA